MQGESLSPDQSKKDELLSLKQILSKDRGDLSIVSPQEIDSLRSKRWMFYLKGKELLAAWSPPCKSPYSKYMKTKTINSVDFVIGRIKPRYSEGEKKSEKELDNLIKFIKDRGPNQFMVILDSGGPHSVAMGAKLARNGFQPVVMLNGIPHSKGVVSSQQGLATLLYFAEEINSLKRNGVIKPNSPPAFILDAHRQDVDIFKNRNSFDNTYSYNANDFPSAEELKALGIKKVIYLNEGDQRGEIKPAYQSLDRSSRDLRPILEEWNKKGIQIFYTGINPWGTENGRIKDNFFLNMQDSF